MSKLLNKNLNTVGEGILHKLYEMNKNRQQYPLDYSETDYYSHRNRKEKTEDYIRIGDCEFTIPPEYIKVTGLQQSENKSSIRQKSSIKEGRSKHKNEIIVQFVISGEQQINGYKVNAPGGNYYYMDGLRSLLSQFSKAPFLPVSNHLLNVQMNIYNVALANISVTSIKGYPDSFMVQLKMYEMNTNVFTNRPEVSYDTLFNWELFRYYYQKNLFKNDKNRVYFKPMDMNTQDFFNIGILKEKFISGFEDVENKDEIYDSKNYTSLVNNTNNSFVIDHMVASMSNVFSELQMSGQATPTFQFLGNTDRMVSFTISTKDARVVASFKNLEESNSEVMLKNNDVEGIGFMKIQNGFINMFGVEYLLLKEINIETQKGFPGLYKITCEAYDFNKHSNHRESIQSFRPFHNRTGNMDDLISQDRKGLTNKVVQDRYVEEKIKLIELYPDLELPTFDELDNQIANINNFRKKNNIKKMKIDKYPREKDDGIFSDPDFYLFYPPITNDVKGEKVFKDVKDNIFDLNIDKLGEPLDVEAPFYDNESGTKNGKIGFDFDKNLETMFCGMKSDKMGRMVKAYPSYLFLILDQANHWLDGQKLWTNYYVNQSLMSIDIMHERNQPIGVANLSITNLYKNLTDKPDATQFEEDPQKDDFLYKHFGWRFNLEATPDMITNKNILLERFNLASGAKIHVRLGYGSNAANYPINFNGYITGIKHDEQIEITAQSDGRELTRVPFSGDEDTTNSIIKLGGEPSEVIKNLLQNRQSLVNNVITNWSESSKYGIESFGMTDEKWLVNFFNQGNKEYLKRLYSEEIENGILLESDFEDNEVAFNKISNGIKQDTTTNYSYTSGPVDAHQIIGNDKAEIAKAQMPFIGLWESTIKASNYAVGKVSDAAKNGVENFKSNIEEMKYLFKTGDFEPSLDKYANQAAPRLINTDINNMDDFKNSLSESVSETLNAVGSAVGSLNIFADHQQKMIDCYDLVKNLYLADESKALPYPSIDKGTILNLDGENNIKMFMDDLTTWDIMKNLDRAMPSFVLSPMYHQFDSRIFYGQKHYLARYKYDIKDNTVVDKGRSFQQWYFLNSKNDIISNKIETDSRRLITNARTKWHHDDDDGTTKVGSKVHADKTIYTNKQKPGVFESDITGNLLGWDTAYRIFGWDPAKNNANKFSISELKESFNNMYDGELIIKGFSNIKPFDMIYINDSFKKMFGNIEAKRVTHSFNIRNGFTTTIKPDLITGVAAEEDRSVPLARTMTSIGHTMQSALILRTVIKEHYEATMKTSLIESLHLGCNDYKTVRNLITTEARKTSVMYKYIAQSNTMQDFLDGLSKFNFFQTSQMKKLKNEVLCYQDEQKKIIELSKNIMEFRQNLLDINDIKELPDEFYEMDVEDILKESDYSFENNLDNAAFVISQIPKFMLASKLALSYKNAIMASLVVVTGPVSVLSAFGWWMAQELVLQLLLGSVVNWFKNRHTILISPLLKDGEPFVNGVDGAENLIPGYTFNSGANKFEVDDGSEKESEPNEWSKDDIYENTMNKVTASQMREQDTFVEDEFRWPIDYEGQGSQVKVNSLYGYRIHPVDGTKKFHTGIDLAKTLGINNINIMASQDGNVDYAGPRGGYGNAVIINHGNGFTTLYAHLKKILVSPGQQVTTNDVIGYMGTTGKSTGVHLHFEIRKNGEHQNPKKYLPKSLNGSAELKGQSLW